MRIFQFPSKSSTSVHTTTVHDSGRITCSCMGSRHGCWHMVEAKKLADAGQEQEVIAEPTTEFIASMLAKAMTVGKKTSKTIEDYMTDRYAMEIKFNGHRMELVKDSSGVRAYARSGLMRILPSHIVAQAERLQDGTFDGELLIPGGTSTDVTALDLQNQANLAIFDMMRVGHESIMEEPLTRRREALLESTMDLSDDSAIQISAQFPVSPKQLEAFWKAGLEGAIIKDLSSHYLPNDRHGAWIKLKKKQYAEFTLIGYKAGLLGPHSKLVLQDDLGILISVKALNDHWRSKFDTDYSGYIGKRVVISYQEKTRDGKYQHPMADHFVDPSLGMD